MGKQPLNKNLSRRMSLFGDPRLGKGTVVVATGCESLFGRLARCKMPNEDARHAVKHLSTCGLIPLLLEVIHKSQRTFSCGLAGKYESVATLLSRSRLFFLAG